MSRARTAECEPAPMPPARSLAIPIEAIDWARIAADLDAQGCATTGRLLSAQQCAELAKTYATDAPFRSRVVMARHGFGRGSAVFLHLARPNGSPTAGCVAFRANDLRRLLAQLGPETRIAIQL